MEAELATIQTALVTGVMCVLFALGFIAGGHS